jgi:hypothetical protein
MLVDPCNAPLIPGAFGDPSLRMLRESKTLTFTVTAGKTHHFLWLPKYHCQAVGFGESNTHPSNLFHFGYNNGDTGPTQVENTTAFPWGQAFARSQTMEDPCYGHVNKTGIRDARTVAACIDLDYTGRNDAECGLVTGFNAKLGDFWAQAAGATYPTVPLYRYDDVFEIGKESRRPGENLHVRYQPNFVNEPFDFFPSSDSPVHVGNTGGTPASSTVSGLRLRTDNPTVLGVAIIGGEADTTFRIRFTKIVEYREDHSIGTLRSTPMSLPPPTTTPLERATRVLPPETWDATWGNVKSAVSAATSFAQANQQAIYHGAKAMLNVYANSRGGRQQALRNELRR